MKRTLLTIAAALSTMAAAVSVQGASVQTPDGTMPVVHWAVVESADGQMSVLQQLGAKHVAPEVAKEGGTYALYGAVDAKNPNIMRVLEFYETEEAYRIHAASDGFRAYDEARRPYLKGVKILEATGIALEQKDNGVGTSVHMDLIQVKPECLEAYAQRLAEEIRRAAADDEHVVGFYATAEKDNPARIHTMGIFTDEAGYEAYISSPAYQSFRRDTQDMIIMQNHIENQPVRITLSRRGVN